MSKYPPRNHRALACILTALLLAIPTSHYVNAQTPTVIPGTPGKALPAPKLAPSPFTIAILPDRTSGKPWGIPYLKTAVQEINLTHPDVVFNIGDMIQGYTRSTSTYQREADEYLNIVAQLNAPFYPLPGNHEVVSGHRDSNDHQFEELYQQTFGPLYYAVHFKDVTTISLYSDEELDSDVLFHEQQFNWLQKQIADAAQRQKTLVVFMHKPAWRYRSSNWQPIHEALATAVQDQGIQVVVVAGHFHSLQRDPDRDGVQYHLVGTCGALIDQHPLSGQFQHLTYLKILPDTQESTLYHHPLGCTLPDDFVVAEDQRRSHMLKSYGSVCTVENIIEQPLGKPIIAELELTLHNPIDRAISIVPQLVKSPPTPSLVSNYGFLSRTQIDIFNPHVTNVNTPFIQTAHLEPITLQPNETRKITVPLRAPAQKHMLPPPQINLTATFLDTQDRLVPVYIRRRVPLKMRYVVSDNMTLNLPISAQTFSVYDLKERDPMLGISASKGHLNLALAVFDNQVSYQATPDLKTRINNPLSDTIIITFGDPGPTQTRFLYEPLNPQHRVYRIVQEINTNANQPIRSGSKAPDPKFQLIPEPDIKVDFEKRPQGFGLIIKIPLNYTGKPGQTVPFNLSISDNDQTYHTQWRRWAPPNAHSTIVLPTHF